MSERIQKRAEKTKKEAPQEQDPKPSAVKSIGEIAVKTDTETEEKLKEELDGLLDEIDTVLEENAAEFVRDYIQKGGQ